MSSSRKMFTLMSGDGVIFEVEEAVVTQSVILKHLIEHDKAVKFIPVPRVTGKILSKVIEYCKKHAGTDDRSVDEEIKAWDAEFVNVDVPTVYDLLKAANNLNIEGLLELMDQKVGDMMKGKSLEQILTLFGTDSDITLEDFTPFGTDSNITPEDFTLYGTDSDITFENFNPFGTDSDITPKDFTPEAEEEKEQIRRDNMSKVDNENVTKVEESASKAENGTASMPE